MERADVVIIGGSAAGATAAVSCRRRNPDKTVILLRQEKQVLVPCGIPYIFGTLGSPEKNLIPDTLLTGNGVRIVVGAAERIDRETKTIHTGAGDQISYDRLVLATGSYLQFCQFPALRKKMSS